MTELMLLVIVIIFLISVIVFLALKSGTKKGTVPQAEYQVLLTESEELRSTKKVLEERAGIVSGNAAVLQTEMNLLRKEKDSAMSLLSAESTTAINLQAKIAEISAELSALKTDNHALQTQISTLRESLSAKESELIITRQQLQQVTGELAEIKTSHTKLAAELSEAKQSNQKYIAVNDSLTEKLSTQKVELENIGKKFTDQFQVLAAKILEDKSIRFTELNKDNLNQLLTPLGEKIKEFEKTVADVYDKESKERFSLAREVKTLYDLNTQMSAEARNLTNALKGNVKTQGNWGEMLLESILQQSGLEKGIHYTVQENLKGDNNNSLRPDVIVTYPDDRQVVIDSKVSLIAYDYYTAANSDEERAAALKALNISLRNHIDGLSGKSYHSFVKSLDFVMLFVPIEPVYIAAMTYDRTLWEYAYKKNVLLISPTNLIAALRIIVDLWKRKQQSDNAEKLAKSCGDLYDKFVGFAEDLEKVGKTIDDSKKSYDSAMSKLSTGRGNLVGRADAIRKLGASTKKQISDKLLENCFDYSEISDASED